MNYFVAKPVLQIQSGSVNALYKNCCNPLTVNCPALGTDYNPSFRATGGRANKGKKKGDVICVPNGHSYSLTVSSGGNVLGVEKFKVRSVPQAALKPFIGGRPANLKTGISTGQARQLVVKAVAEEGFKKALPGEANYRPSGVTYIAVRKGKAMKSARSASQLASVIQPGDQIVIEVSYIDRKHGCDSGRDHMKVGALDKYISVPIR